MTATVFHKLSIQDKDLYDKYYRLSESPITDMTFNCRYAWDAAFHSELAVINDCLVMVSDGGCFTEPHMLIPLGIFDANGLMSIIEAVRPVFAERGWKMKIMGIDEGKLPIFEKLPSPNVHFCFNNDYSDYLYSAEELRTLSSEKLRKKRGHVNRFLRQYPDCKYSSVTGSDRDDCLLLVKSWCDSKGIDIDDCQNSDYPMIKRLFDDFDALDIYGGVIRIGGEVAAFSLGSLGNHNRAFIHFEKANPIYDGAYPAINQMVLINEFPDVETVDREEDLGIPGLRKSKQSYYPVELLKKFSCRVETE